MPSNPFTRLKVLLIVFLFLTFLLLVVAWVYYADVRYLLDDTPILVNEVHFRLTWVEYMGLSLGVLSILYGLINSFGRRGGDSVSKQVTISSLSSESLSRNKTKIGFSSGFTFGVGFGFGLFVSGVLISALISYLIFENLRSARNSVSLPDSPTTLKIVH